MRLLLHAGGGRLRLAAAIALAAATVLLAGLLSAPPAQAGLRDNLANARLCLHGGWATLQTSTGRSFRNAGWCVIYALAGGQFGVPAPPPPPPPTL